MQVCERRFTLSEVFRVFAGPRSALQWIQVFRIVPVPAASMGLSSLRPITGDPDA